MTEAFLNDLSEEQMDSLLSDGEALAADKDPRLNHADRLREIHVAAKDFKQSTEPVDVAAAAFVERLSATTAHPENKEFNWNLDDNPDVVCPEQLPLAIYVNRFDQAVIRQRMDWNEDDDTVICISKHHLQEVIDRLQRILSEG